MRWQLLQYFTGVHQGLGIGGKVTGGKGELVDEVYFHNTSPESVGKMMKCDRALKSYNFNNSERCELSTLLLCYGI